MAKKVCKKCKIFVEESNCPICKGDQFSTSWQGRITIIDDKNSEIGKKISAPRDGEYVIKVR